MKAKCAWYSYKTMTITLVMMVMMLSPGSSLPLF